MVMSELGKVIDLSDLQFAKALVFISCKFSENLISVNCLQPVNADSSINFTLLGISID